MRKRSDNIEVNEEPPVSNLGTNMYVKPGEVLTDVTGAKWKLGESVGVGGFGEIFLASDKLNKEVDDGAEYVAKIESHTNGPLFVEINCYLRIAKEEMINDWKSKKNMQSLGMPHYVASGSHYIDKIKYRFLILPRYKTDLESMLQQKKQKLNMKTVLIISLQLLEVLQYIHNNGFVHADVKASNILLDFKRDSTDIKKVGKRHDKQPTQKQLIRYLGNIHGPIRSCRLAKSVVVYKNLRSNHVLHHLTDIIRDEEEKPKIIDKPNNKTNDQMYLLDYGLASKYLLSNNEHKQYCMDQRRAHAGTILFCSLDAHKGVLSRRSDLESLGYNIIYWLTSSLPWQNDVDNPEFVCKKKQQCISELEPFLIFCFGKYPKFLYEYFKYLKKLDYTTKPDYNLIKQIFLKALKEYGFKNDGSFDIDKPNDWLNKPKKKKTDSENMKCIKIARVINRAPLTSNLPIKKVLRKKNKNKNLCILNWSKILMDPEVILKQGKTRERKLTESSDGGQSLSSLNINDLNPTEAMLEVYHGYIDRTKTSEGASPKYKGDRISNNIDGYTSAMMQVYNRMMERKEFELQKFVIKNTTKPKPQKRLLRSGYCTRNKTKSSASVLEIRSRGKVDTRRSKSSSSIYRLRG